MAGEALSKSQADKIGEDLRHGEMTAQLIERLSGYRNQLVENAGTAADVIRSLTLYPVTPREGKSTGSIVAKLRRQPVALSRMQDIVGCRIVVDTIVEQDALALRIATRFHDARIVDRRAEPSFGYRAVHLILRWNSHPYEVQVRTRLQHAWAQTVERLSDRLYPNLKYGEGPDDIRESIQRTAASIAEIELMETKLFHDRTDPDYHETAATLTFLRSAIINQLDRIVASE
jgi:ppGpp synthetase/RelA/SpoT-type nucleotidyltranferase